MGREKRAALLILLALLVGGCGKEATHEECEGIPFDTTQLLGLLQCDEEGGGEGAVYLHFQRSLQTIVATVRCDGADEVCLADQTYTLTMVVSEEEGGPATLYAKGDVGPDHPFAAAIAPLGEVAVGAEKPSGAPNVLFPTATELPDGRILFAGGFSKVIDDGERYEVGQATNRAYLFDPSTVMLTQTANEMNKARGAHAAIYLPNVTKVLIVGGAERIYLEKDDSCFPWYFSDDTAGSVGYTYELFDLKSEKFLQWDTEDWPDPETGLDEKSPRIFPRLLHKADHSVLVTGGGAWPSCDLSQADLPPGPAPENYEPKTNVGSGRFSAFEAPWSGPLAGHAAVTLGTDSDPYHLLVGGTVDGPMAWACSEGEGPTCVAPADFKPVSFWLEGGAIKRRPFFHSLTPLTGRRLLLAGGVDWRDGALRAPVDGDLFLLEQDGDDWTAVPVAGDWKPRLFHTATTDNGSVVTIFGGISAEDGELSTALADIRFFFSAGSTLVQPAFDDPGAPRGGHAAALMPNGCLAMFGGSPGLPDGLEGGPLTWPLELGVYCPSHLCPDGLPDGVCPSP